jgi:hypothetical protein
MAGWHRAQVGGGGADRLDAGFLIVRDDGDRRFAGTDGRPAHLDFAVNAENFGHFRLELGIAPLQVVTNPRLRGGRLLWGFTSCAARILHTVPWASCARHGWPALGP